MAGTTRAGRGHGCIYEVTESTIRKLISKGYLDRGNGEEIRLKKADVINAVQSAWHDWAR